MVTIQGRSKFTRHMKTHEGINGPTEGREEAEMAHPYSQYRGGNRKYSFQLPEDGEEGRFPAIIQQTFETSSFLRKRKASSD